MRRIAVLVLLGICGCESTGPSITAIAIVPNPLAMILGESRSLIVRDQDGHELSAASATWSVSNAVVASITPTGLLTAVSEGSATITATVGGKTASAPLTVVAFTFTSVTAGEAHTCGLTTGGVVRCWGRSESGQLGVTSLATNCTIDGVEYPCSTIPVVVQGSVTFTQIDAGGAHTCGITAQGAAYCWGRNNAGQLGDNSSTNSAGDHQSSPVPVSGGLTFTKISVGPLHTCGLISGGAAYCWGANGRGQLGDGTTTNRLTPVAVSGGLTFTSISTGGYTSGVTCGVTANGAAYCWGENASGLLGAGSADLNAHSAPTPVSGGITFASVAAGASHVCGVATSGFDYCWGANVNGSLGDGTTTPRVQPTLVGSEFSFGQLAAGGFSDVNAHSCGLSGVVAYCWGDNAAGALGDGSGVSHPRPLSIAAPSFASIAAGARHTCGVATTGVLYCWGSNRAGQLGDATITQRLSPTRVMGQK